LSWAAVIVGGATLVGAAASSRSASRAADAQGRASRDAIDAQTEAERRALAMQEPFYEAGYAATAAMMDMAGLDRSGLGASARVTSARDRGVVMGDTLLPEGTYSDSPSNKKGSNIFYNGQRIGRVVPGGPNGRFVNDTGFDVDGTFRTLAGSATATESPADLSSYDKYDWKTDPGYQFRLDEGTRALERSAAARGILNSGGTLRSATRYAQDYASNEYQRVFDRISTIAGRGQSAATTGSNVIVGTGENVGRALVNAGEARASGYIAQGNAWANAANQGMTLYGYLNRPSGGSPSLYPMSGADPYGYYNGNAMRLS
jgi:hypothetical protein